MLILAILVAGLFVGWLAQLILGSNSRNVDWGIAIIAGFGGSLVGGLLFSLIAGDGLALKPSGFIGSLLGALIVTAGWQAYNRKSR